MKLGPYRLWLKNENYPGLAMSRSIGDFCAHSVGGISEPGNYFPNKKRYSNMKLTVTANT